MTIKEIENQLKKLPPSKLSAFRKWFHRFDAERWDAQMEGDINSGKLNRLAEKAMSSYRAGKAKKI